MPDTLSSLLIGALGGVVTASIQHVFRRFSETEQVRREVVEKHLLQLQNSVESLYYRANNLQDWAGKSVMPDQYYEQSTAYIIARVLAHESLLLSEGVYAKLPRRGALKGSIKAKLHALNWGLDDQRFLHYHRVQLGEMALDGARVLTYTEFLQRWAESKYSEPVRAVSGFMRSIEPGRLERTRVVAGQLVELLSGETGVPSARADERSRAAT
jgi:hypothetical protein